MRGNPPECPLSQALPFPGGLSQSAAIRAKSRLRQPDVRYWPRRKIRRLCSPRVNAIYEISVRPAPRSDKLRTATNADRRAPRWPDPRPNAAKPIRYDARRWVNHMTKSNERDQRSSGGHLPGQIALRPGNVRRQDQAVIRSPARAVWNIFNRDDG